MDYDRLRELQAKFDENPRRYFAPLANEYRKGGNPKRAIEICRAHLAQMPGHMSGQVVYGQALVEGAEFDEARTVFEGALVLDPENLIALRSLGDLALQAGNTQEARSWYARLLDADPKDQAVLALVAEIDANPAAESESTFTVDFSFVEGATAPPLAPTAAAVDADSSSAAPPASEPALDDPTSKESAVEGLTSHQPEPESPLAHVEAGATEPDAGESDTPLGLERHYPTDDHASETLPVAEPMGPDRDALDDRSPSAAAAAHGATPPPGSSSFAGTSREPFVNETMAQLYLQQGYRQLALRVYRQLSEMRPGEQALKDRIAEIEATQDAEDRGAPSARREAPSIESPIADPAAPRAPSIESPLPHGPGSQPGSVESPSNDRSPIDSPPTSVPSREPDSIDSPGREEPRAEPDGMAARQPSIREFFATLGRRRPPRPGSASGTRGNNESSATASPSSASLDAVFAGASTSATDARAASTLAGAFSASARGTGAPPPPTSTPTPRASPRLQTQESEEDVAKFRAWLDGLTGE